MGFQIYNPRPKGFQKIRKNLVSIQIKYKMSPIWIILAFGLYFVWLFLFKDSPNFDNTIAATSSSPLWV